MSHDTQPKSDELRALPTAKRQNTPESHATLRETVAMTMQRYFHHLDGETVTDLYDMVLAEVEAPLLRSVMEYVNGNQTHASQMLGLNRGTLRKKLKRYDLL